MPALADLLEQIASQGVRVDNTPRLVPLTPEQKKRADFAAMMSMLWLSYGLHGGRPWRPEDFDGSLWSSVFEGVDPLTAILAAREKYAPELVRNWMRQTEELEQRGSK
jgi:hypothetical protein